jgi:hypothetical protein
MVNNVIGVVNYVIAARPSLLNFMIADSQPGQAFVPGPDGLRPSQAFFSRPAAWRIVRSGARQRRPAGG